MSENYCLIEKLEIQINFLRDKGQVRAKRKKEKEKRKKNKKEKLPPPKQQRQQQQKQLQGSDDRFGKNLLEEHV